MFDKLLKSNSLNADCWLKEVVYVLDMDFAVVVSSPFSAAAPVFLRGYLLVNACPFSAEGGNLVLFFPPSKLCLSVPSG